MKYLQHILLCVLVGLLAGFTETRRSYAFEPMISQIVVFGSNFCPRGWMEAKGQLLDINQNQALFSLLGTTYGGDGRTNFALPNLQTSQTKSGAPVACIAVTGLFPSRN